MSLQLGVALQKCRWARLKVKRECEISACKRNLIIGEYYPTTSDDGRQFSYCEECYSSQCIAQKVEALPKPRHLKKKGFQEYLEAEKRFKEEQEKRRQFTSFWEIPLETHYCCNNNCKKIVLKNTWAVHHQNSDGWWCEDCGKKFAGMKDFENIEPFYEKDSKKEMMPFQTLSNKDKAIVISKRFNLKREEVETWTSEKMEHVWTHGVGNEQQIPSEAKLEGVSEKRVNELIDLKTPGIVQIARDSMAPDIKAIKELILSKREVEIITPKKDIIKVGKQHFKYEDVMRLVNLKLNVWMGGPAGAGKTYLASEIARALEMKFFRISCGPQTSASQIFGHTTAHGGYAPGIAYQAIKTDGNGAILLFDEFDRLNPAVAVMVNGLLDGNAVTFPNGETLKLGDNGCIALVAANTFGKPTAEFGTAQRQDIATMSRFVKILIPVDEKLEMSLFGPIDEEWVKFVQKVRATVSRLGITSIVVTPRASEYGVKMLANGLSRKNVEDLLLWNGVPAEDIKKIKANLGA